LHDAQSSPTAHPDIPSLCKQCGAALKLMMRLPLFGAAPDLRLIKCTACGFVAWDPATV
jgi:hypothetical protein